MTIPLGGGTDAGQGGPGPRILLISPDLMAASRLDGLVRDCGGRLATVRSLEAALPEGSHDLLLLDLQAGGDPAALVAACRGLVQAQRAGAGPAARVVAFGPHVAKDRLEQATAAGADAAVSRGELLGDFRSLVSRWCG